MKTYTLATRSILVSIVEKPLCRKATCKYVIRFLSF